MIVIHIFSREWPPHEGVARYIETLSKGLHSVSKDMTIALVSLWNYDKISMHIDKEEKIAILKIPRFRTGPARLETFYSILQHLLIKHKIINTIYRRENFILHIHMPTYFVPSHSFTYGLTFHGFIHPYENNFLKLFDLAIPSIIVKKMIDKACFSTAVGFSTATILRSVFQRDFFTVLTPLPYDALRISESHRNTERDIILINAKNIEIVTRILQGLDHSHVKDSCIIIFGVPKKFFSKLYEFKRKANTCIKVFGFISHNTLLKLLLRSELFIFTSHGEGMPTLVLEALALGTPTIVPRVRGCVDLAKLYRLPIYKDERDVVMMIDELLRKQEYYKRFFDHVSEAVRNLHHPKRIAQAFYQLYTNAINGVCLE
jgi:glycosyltransferase involved in cell wall biosynthesis